MSWRFRRSVKVAPGVRLNFGKSGFTSWSVGGRGGRVTFGKRGVTRTMGIRGTGLSYTERISGPPRTTAVAPVPVEPPAPDRFGLVRPTAPESAGVARLLLFGLAAVLVPAAIIFGAPLLWLSVVVSGIIGAALPSRASTQARLDDEHRRAIDAERERRQAQVASAVETVNPNADEAALRQVLALPAALELTDSEVDYGAMERVRAALDLMAFAAQVAANGDALTRLAGEEVVVGASACWFIRERVLYDKRGDNDPTGTLYLTTDETVFHAAGEENAAVPWSKVMAVTRSHRTLSVQRRDRKTPHAFIFDALGDACIAEYVARRLWSEAPARRTARRGDVTA